MHVIPDKMSFERNRERNRHYLNSLVYGFEYIYDIYRNLVLPLICTNSEGDLEIGTGFRFLDGIVTAKHCVSDSQSMRIKGYCAEELTGKDIYVSANDEVDLAFIHSGKSEGPQVFIDEGVVLDDVLVMGYPKIPVFLPFLAAETAKISSTAESRITPTLGQIAAVGYDYLAKIEAMLITARIRGGNSGGPVINRRGCIVGIACQTPSYQVGTGSYDDLGYGIAIPAKHLIEIVNQREKKNEVKDGFFLDWEE